MNARNLKRVEAVVGPIAFIDLQAHVAQVGGTEPASMFVGEKRMEAGGFEVRSQIIWAKERLVIGRGDYHWQHEPCWYAVRNKGHWAGDRKQTTLWSISSRDQDQETEHSTQKPVECMRRPILNNSAPGDTIYEPFSGSGTTLIAAEMTGRRCLAMEIDPAYCDVTVRRWQDLTGKQALLDGDYGCFGDVEAERG